MDIQVKKLPHSEVSITITVDEDALTKFRTRAAQSLGEKVKIPGFRPGNAPAYVVESEVGKEAFFEEMLRFALPETYIKAIEQEKLEVVTRPKINILSKSPLQYEATVALLPEITIKGYDKVKIPKEEAKVASNEIDELVEEMRKYRATYKKRDGKAQKGDRVEIDFEGFDEQGVSLEKTKSTRHPLVIGDETLVPGFEDHLIGMGEGETKSFDVTFPKDYHHKPFQNKKIKFTVLIHAVEERILPELDEGFVKNVLGQQKSVDEFKTIVSEDFKRRKAQELMVKRENSLIAEWLKLAKVEIPQLLLEEEIDYCVDQLKRDVADRGIPWEQYEKHLASQKKDLRADYTKEAEKRIKIRLILRKLFEEESIIVTEEEMLAEIKRIIARYPENERNKAKMLFDKKGNEYIQLQNQLRLAKLLKKFLD